MIKRVLWMVLHALATGMLAVLFCLAALAHDRWAGAPMVRGVSVGISMELVLTAHLVINLIISQLNQMSVKLVCLLAFAGVTLYLLLPFHPVRAIFLVTVGVLVSTLAILAGNRIVEGIGT